MFSLPGKKIPDWFARQTRGESISFWFRNKFPAISLCLIIGLVDEQRIRVKFSPRVIINGNKVFLGSRKVHEFSIATDHLFLFDIELLKFEDNVHNVHSENKWNLMEVSFADHITNHDFPIKRASKYCGIHGDMEDIQFPNPPLAMINENLDLDSIVWRQRVKITTNQPQKDQNMVLSSPILPSTKPPPSSKADKGLDPRPTPLVRREDVEGETSERLPEEEIHPTIQNDPSVSERHCEGDVETEAVSSSEFESEESFSNTTGSDSDDPFNWVDRKLSVNGKEAVASGTSSGSLTYIREAIEALEQLMVKDLSEVYSDPSVQAQLNHALGLLTGSNHPKVKTEMREALVEFTRKAFASFQEFHATVESVNKLKNFEKQKARIQKETSAGKKRRKDLRNSIKKASVAIKVESSRKRKLEAEIATLREQLDSKELDFEQLVLNLKNQEAALSTYLKNRNSLKEQAQLLSKEADDLLTANRGVEDEGKAAEVKQNLLKSTWSSDLPSQLNKIKCNIIGL